MALRTIAAQVNFLRKAGRLEEALILARNGLDRRIRRYGHDDPRSLFAEIQVANVLGRLGHYVEADLHAAHILRVLGDDSTSPIAIDASSWHGVCLVETEQPKEGERFLARAFDGYRRIYGDKHEQTLNTCAYLVRAHSLLGDRDAALAMQRMVVEITAGIHGQDSSQSLHASLQLAVWLHWAGCNDESRRLAEHVALALGADPNDAKRARGLLDELDDTGGSSG
jgi:tetratricopeptide (TPR) repeat protein